MRWSSATSRPAATRTHVIATAPARIHSAEDAERKEQQASKMGFSAYAIGKEMDDPLVQAIHKLLEHAALTDARVDRLVESLKQGGVDTGEDRKVADGFDPRQIDKTLG